MPRKSAKKRRSQAGVPSIASEEVKSIVDEIVDASSSIEQSIGDSASFIRAKEEGPRDAEEKQEKEEDDGFAVVMSKEYITSINRKLFQIMEDITALKTTQQDNHKKVEGVMQTLGDVLTLNSEHVEFEDSKKLHEYNILLQYGEILKSIQPEAIKKDFVVNIDEEVEKVMKECGTFAHDTISTSSSPSKVKEAGDKRENGEMAEESFRTLPDPLPADLSGVFDKYLLSDEPIDKQIED